MFYIVEVTNNTLKKVLHSVVAMGSHETFAEVERSYYQSIFYPGNFWYELIGGNDGFVGINMDTDIALRCEAIDACPEDCTPILLTTELVNNLHYEFQ